MNNFIIEPLTITTTKTITKFNINYITVNLFDSVNINVVLFDENNLPCDTKNYIMNGDEYKLWGDDDNYIVEWIKSKIN